MKIQNFRASKLTIASLLISSILLFSQCKKEEASPIGLNESATNVTQANLVAATSAPAGAYNIQNSLPAGYVKDGSRDYTSYIQSAIDKYSEIVFPGFPIMVSDIGLKIGSNKRITFLDGSEIRLKASSNPKYDIINMRGVTNVTLVDPVIVGDRNNHIGTSGEFGIGIGMRGSSNITLTNPKVSNCWGDGILIAVENNVGCKNITITNGYVTNNRRDGMSIISVDGLKIDKFYAGFTQGTSPQSGINFEPDSPTENLKNIVINNLTTEANAGYGVQMGLGNLFGGGNKYVDITLNNHVDKQSFKAMKFSAYTTRKAGSEVISANVIFNNPSWKQHPLVPRDNIVIALFENAQKLTIKTPSIQTAAGVTLSESSIVTLLTRLFNRGSNVELTFVNEPSPAPAPEQPSSNSGDVVFAVNAGGSDYTASNGIKYLSDRNFIGGRVYKTSNLIGNTSDDALYQSERNGNFSYAIPLSNGTYEITIKLAEIYQTAIGRRLFDIKFEGIQHVSNLDIFAMAGKNNVYDIVKTVDVTDGTLNLQFITDIDNAKVSAFHVIKK